MAIDFTKYHADQGIHILMELLEEIKNDPDIKDFLKQSKDTFGLPKKHYSHPDLSIYLNDVYFELLGAGYSNNNKDKIYKVTLEDSKCMEILKKAGYHIYIHENTYTFIDLGEFLI